MADEEEERVLEQQLELQLHEQRESLSSLNDILTSDPSNPEVLAVHEELVLAIRDAEEGLFHLKRARLLREVDSVAGIYNPTGDEGDVKVEPVVPDDAEAEPLEEEGQAFIVGSKCRFRHIDGRWYNGQIIGMDGGSDSAKVSFLTPTSEKMLMCKFFLQQRCRFATNCRLSHGVDIPVSSLRKFVPTSWEQSLVGSNIWALSDSGIWKEAELDTWDDESSTGKVVFKDDGSCANLGVGSIALSEHASPLSDEEEETDSSSLDESELSEYDEEEEPQGLGFTTQQLKGGIQTETVMFAKWENHTRGIASKMMASMGYREGMGLGVSGQGMVDPIPVKVLPAKQSLELALQSEEHKKSKDEGKGKKRSRGGRRKQERRKSKLAEAAEADEELRRPDVFSLINRQLAIHAEKLNEGSGKKKKKKGSNEKKIERKDLVAYDDEVKELRVGVKKLEEMVERNRKEKAVYEAAMRKLKEMRKALADAESNHASATNSLNAKDKEKKWLKF